MIVEDGNLTVQVARLRALLETDADRGEWIVTVPRVGYRLLRHAPTAPASVLPLPAKPSIAVMPFANLSVGETPDFHADGLVDDLITGLSRFRTFAVVSRNSAFAYKGRAIDARQAAAELGVRYLLEGSIRRASNRVRITAQLIEGATGIHLWAERFQGEVADIFDFHDRITASVIGLIERDRGIPPSASDLTGECQLDTLGDHFLHSPHPVVAKAELLQMHGRQVNVLRHRAEHPNRPRQRVGDGLIGEMTRVADAPSRVREREGT
jgi:TolB-like protein